MLEASGRCGCQSRTSHTLPTLCRCGHRGSSASRLRRLFAAHLNSLGKMKFWLSVSLPLYLLDQLAKALVLTHISTDEIVPIIPGFFNLVQVHNTGAAFGMLKNN